MALLLLSPVSAAAPGTQSVRHYNKRMEVLFRRLDVNGDGRIDFKVITDTRVQIMYAVP